MSSSRPTLVPFYQVDAFTTTRFGGNPAAVCLVPKSLALSSTTMQSIAAENNLPETAFLQLDSDSADDFSTSARFGLRWFTPTAEVPLCGHATLASAAAIFAEVNNASSELEFLTLSGSLYVKKLEGSADGRAGPLLEMKCPCLPPSDPVPENLGIGSKLVSVLAAGLPVAEVVWRSNVRYLVVRFDDGVSQAQLEALSPDLSAVQDSTGETGITGVILTCRGEKEDVASRFFAPWMGIPEDPVTGSAHSVLSPYWGGLLKRSTLTARQCSKRGGTLEMEQAGDSVLIRGYAVTVIRGEMLIDG